MSGLGTSGTSANSATTSAPYAPAQGNLNAALSNAAIASNAGAANSGANDPSMWQGAAGTAANLPNPGTQAANTGAQFLTGDPNSLLNSSLQAYQGNMNPIANMSANPMNNPATQQLMQAIQDQTQQSINGQFAGAGRSMSGYNTKDLAMGLSEGEAPTLFNQYNQNLANIQAANQGILGAGQTTSAAEAGNKATGLQMQAGAPAMSLLPAQSAQTALNTPYTNQAQMAALGENLTIPIAGLGGTSQGTGTGTATASPLSQLAQTGSAATGVGTAGLLGLLAAGLI